MNVTLYSLYFLSRAAIVVARPQRKKKPSSMKEIGGFYPLHNVQNHVYALTYLTKQHSHIKF